MFTYKPVIIFLLTAIHLCAFTGYGQLRQVYVDPFDDNNHIEKISFYSAKEGYVAFTKWIGFTTDTGRTFIQKPITWGNVDYNGYSVNLTFGFGVSGVKAFNRDTIIVYGNYGFVPAILYSIDQGNSFKVVYHSTLNAQELTDGITDMIFPENSITGYAVEADRIIKTTNRGVTWSVVRTDPNSFFDYIEGVSNTTLFAFNTREANRKLLKTTNSGSNWQAITLPSAGRISYAHFISPDNGWLNIAESSSQVFSLYYTNDGGQTWTLKNDPVAAPFSTSKMKFINDSTGYAQRYLYDVYKTTDSGKVWEQVPRDNNYSYLAYGFEDISFYGTNQFWAGGQHGFLELSTNAGGTLIPNAYLKVDTLGVLASGTVRLVNYSKQGYQYKWYVNDVLISTNYHSQYIHNIARNLDTVKLVVTNGSISDSVTKYQYFVVPPITTITSFSPMTATTGAIVTINGTNLSSINGVYFGGTPAASFQVISSGLIQAIVGTGSTGNLSVTNIYSTTSAPGFTFVAPPSGPPPLIASLSSSSGNLGTPITITGQYFGTAAANNIVYFGKTKAVITSASATQINCTVPPGAIYGKVSVLNTTTGLKGFSTSAFNVTFADSSNFTFNSFKSKQAFVYPSLFSSWLTRSGSAADFDGDGLCDVVIASGFTNDSILLYRNTGTAAQFSFPGFKTIGWIPGAGSQRFDIQDIDNDGKLDIAATTNEHSIFMIRNNSQPGTISFDPLIDQNIADGSQDVVLDDLDGDGRLDVAAAGFNGNKLSVLRNTSSPGAISFTPRTDYTAGGHCVRLVVADLDGDGKKDVLTLNYISGSVSNMSFYRNTGYVGNINFDPRVDIAIPGAALTAQNLVATDYDGDGKTDIILLNDNNFVIYRNNTSGGVFSLVAVVTSGSASTNKTVRVANLSGTTRPDMVISVWPSRNLNLYRNISSPGQVVNEPVFNIAENYPTNLSGYFLDVADFNLDGKPDLLGSAGGSKEVIIFTNQMGVAIDQRVCTGGNRSIAADITGSVYQWQINTGTGFVNLTDNANVTGSNTAQLDFTNVSLSWNGYRYQCLVDNYKSSVFELRVTGPAPPDVAITVPSVDFCGGSPVVFTATPSVAGNFPSYYWQINEVNVSTFPTGSNQFTTYGLQNNDRVRVIIVSNDMCGSGLRDTSNVITMHLLAQVPGVSISGPAGTTCVNNSVTFTATPVNGGTAPFYQWQVNFQNVGTNSPEFITTQLYNQDRVRVLMTSNAQVCGSANPVASNIIIVPVSSNTPVTYTFTGNGNWSNPANWSNNIVPPTAINTCAQIIINPIAGGECVLDVMQILPSSTKLVVMAGKKLVVPGIY